MGKRTVLTLLLAMCGAAAFAQNLPRIVVLPLENRAGEQHAYDVETITELLSAFINETLRLNVISRLTLETAMAARNWQVEDWDNIAKTAEMGMALNATYIVRGSVSLLGENLLVSAQVLDIATAELMSFYNMQLEDVSEAYIKMNSLAQLLTYNLPMPEQPEPLPVVTEVPPMLPPPPEPAAPDTGRAARLNTLGVSIGSSFADPLLIASVHGTFSPLRNLFLGLGFDIGMISGIDGAESYYSLYPFARIGYFLPFKEKGGWYAGAGIGYMTGKYTFTGGIIPASVNVFAADFTTGFNLWNMLDISYTLRTNFKSASNKVMAGYTYRFK